MKSERMQIDEEVDLGPPYEPIDPVWEDWHDIGVGD